MPGIGRDFLKIPNIISGCRIIIAIYILFLFQSEKYLLAFIWYIIGAASDWLDGCVARTLGQVTTLGKAMDPFADKVFYLGSLISVGIPMALRLQIIPLLALEILLLCVGIYGLKLVLKDPHCRVETGANKWGKRKAILEVIIFILFFLEKIKTDPNNFNLIYLSIPMLWAAIACAALSLYFHCSSLPKKAA